MECRVEISMMQDKGDPSKVTTTFSPGAETIIQGIIRDKEKEIAEKLKKKAERVADDLYTISGKDIDEVCRLQEKNNE